MEEHRHMDERASREAFEAQLIARLESEYDARFHAELLSAQQQNQQQPDEGVSMKGLRLQQTSPSVILVENEDMNRNSSTKPILKMSYGTRSAKKKLYENLDMESNLVKDFDVQGNALH
jgi:hypothetical protein